MRTGLLVFLALITLGYMLPFCVAAWRHHPNAPAIGVLNTLLGWTVIGWIVALVWASTSPALPNQLPT
jgi:hypothetical protein